MEGGIGIAVDRGMTHIKTAKTLRELCDALNEYNEHNEQTLEYDRLLSSLPTFGGSEPDDTYGVYSWDDTHLLVPVEGGKFGMAPRYFMVQ